MIFVVTGVHEHGFNRLVKAVDDLARGKIIHDVFIQTGFSTYQPECCEWNKAIDFMEFEKYMDEAEVIISHGGAGCIAGALERGKPAVIVPRLKKYNEHNNDHQLELASVLEKAGRVLVAYEMTDLAQKIESAKEFIPQAATGESCIVEIIRRFVTEVARKKGKQVG